MDTTGHFLFAWLGIAQARTEFKTDAVELAQEPNVSHH